MKDIKRIKKLVVLLNQYRDSYYNDQISIVPDFEYDRLFDELKSLEESTGIVLSNSPTQTVGYEVKSELVKVKHSHLMLSLDKTKSVGELKKFAGDQQAILSLKLDGLTILLTYENGKLIQAETRGSGEEGEIVTHNAKVFENIPLNIDYKGRLEIEGEAIITYGDFDKINSLIDNVNDRYKNPRNLASGSVRQLDSGIAAQRHINFIAWKVPTSIDNFDYNDSFLHRLFYIKNLGFEVVPLLTYDKETDGEHINEMIEALKNAASNMGYPIDGLVMTYNDVPYGESLGCTGHHPKHSIAFKFFDEEEETTLKDIEFTMGKTGVLTPTAVFDPVEISGSTIEKASLHNLSIMEELLGETPYVGQTIIVYKANDIIPQISRADKNYSGTEGTVNIPTECPVCGGKTEIVQDNDSKVLICTNPDCKGKLLGKLTHFVSKNAMNIVGLSEATLEKFIILDWLNNFIDIYHLKDHSDEMMNLDGFAEKSVKKLLNSIEKSKETTLDRFIYALCIPLIGKSASKTISKHFDGNFETFYKEGCLKYFDYENLDDFGNAMSESMRNYIFNNIAMIKKLSDHMKFKETETKNNSSASLNGMTFVITGSLNAFSNRDEAKERIEAAGGKVTGSVTSKTNYLVNNDINSTSGKNKKAKELGVKIITEEELLNMLN